MQRQDHPTNRRTIRFVSPELLKHALQEYEMTPVQFGDDNEEFRVVQTVQDISLQHKDRQTDHWITDYSKTKDGPLHYHISSGYFETIKQPILLLKGSRGSGGYLSYIILAKNNGKVDVLVDKADVYRGDIFLEQGRLLEKRDVRYSEWVLRHGRLTLIPYMIPKIPGALRIEYAILPDGRVKIGKTRYTAPVGTIVQTIRTDSNEIKELGFIDSGEGDSNRIKYLDDYKQAFQIVKPGIVEVKLVPDLDWSKKFTFTIEAK